MVSAAEIIEIRRRWGNLKPGDCKHEKDVEEVFDRPQGDKLGTAKKRNDGKYKCLHKVNEQKKGWN
jgi:hypothetical protein